MRTGRRYVDKLHQIDHLRRGEARRLNALLPDEVPERGGRTAGQQAYESGRLGDAARKGGQRSRELAQQLRDALGTED